MKKSLLALAFGTLALGMSEFVMMGILPDIARSLGVSIPEAGHLISAYALGVCFGAPLMVLVARKRPLKQILLALTAMIAAGNLCASLAPDYWSLLGLRFVSGLPHGAFFGVGSSVAERVADAGKRTEAGSLEIYRSGEEVGLYRLLYGDVRTFPGLRSLLPIFLPVLLYLPSILSYKTVRVYSIICRESNAWNFRVSKVTWIFTGVPAVMRKFLIYGGSCK